MKPSKLTPSQIDMAIKELPDWKINANGEIEKQFVSSGFPQSMLFVNAVALLAESKAHHPDVLIQWNKVRLALTTHDSGGLTEKDFELARSINLLPLL